jgi:hypothetical protein
MSLPSNPCFRPASAHAGVSVSRLARPSTRIGGALLAAAAGLALPLVLAAVAHAGTFTIADCPDARSMVAGPWAPLGATADSTFKDQCGGELGESIWFAVAELPSDPIGFRASTVGTSLTILDARLWWRAFGGQSGNAEANIAVTDAAEEYVYIGTSNGAGVLAEQMAAPQEISLPLEDQATTVSLTENCEAAGQCPLDPSESFVALQIFGAELTLNDPTPPSVTITGFQHEAGSVISGPVQVSFSAEDPNAGVQRAELLVDGAAVATHDYSSSCSFTRLQPCPGSVSDQLEVAGAGLPEGTHQLAVRITDAAGNTTVSASQEISTARSRPVPHIPNGVPCPDPTIALTADGKPVAVTVPFGRGAVIEGRVACGPTPVSGASITAEISTLADVAAVSSPPVETSTQGTFRYQLPPGPSRTLTFAYVAYSNETTPTAQSAVQMNVTPRITLRIKPRRTHNRGKVHWRGRIEGGPYPPGGVPMLVEVKEGGRKWTAFDQIKVKDGKIKFAYTFLRTYEPATYTFRVALPAGGAVGYPYAFGSSPAVKVHVR